MPSPFPGMDPYLEAPDIWPDLHDALASEIRGYLNQVLPAPYYARLEMRPEIGILEEGNGRRIVADVGVARPPAVTAGTAGTATAVATVAEARTDISPSLEVKLAAEPLRHQFIEIRDPTRGHHLITLIEIVSPSNKRPGKDRDAYQKKQQEVLQSDANLVELDLLRDGQRLLADPWLEDYVSRLGPAADYLVLVNRAWRRSGTDAACEVFPIAITGLLPCVRVPLRQELAEVPLDLQYVFNRAYDAGPYRRGAVDYTQPPAPALNEEKRVWAERLLRQTREKT